MRLIVIKHIGLCQERQNSGDSPNFALCFDMEDMAINIEYYSVSK